MNNDMKCPFCQHELEIGGVDGILRGCPKCRNLGTEMLWQELIYARKALDIAVDALKELSRYGVCGANKALEQIDQILEQKDKR